MDYAKAEEYVMKRLNTELSSDLYYHGPRHTVETIRATTEFAAAEGVSGEELELLRTAALYHDIGYITCRYNNERIGAEIARATLGDFGYSATQIERIAALILATRWPCDPSGLLEEILCDADLEYLGSERFEEYAELYRREMACCGQHYNESEWLDFEIDFMRKHRFFTAAAKCSRGASKERHLKELLEKQKNKQDY